MGTYGICGAVNLLGGMPANMLCTVVTTPRTVDCMLNALDNCYNNDCGLLNMMMMHSPLDYIGLGHKSMKENHH